MFLLPALIVTWIVAGTLDFTPGGILAGKLGRRGASALLLALYMFGIGKAALMPFHRWLPAAMVAPTPVSALLHAVAVVKAGVFSVVKVIVYVFGIDTLLGAGVGGWLVVVAGFTILAASVVALRADNLKRRLAYSTVSQLSYVVLAAALLAPLSVIGAALHIAAHALGKITLFFAAGAIYTAAHKTEVSELDGIGRRMPWTMGAFAIGALSMIGLPPTAGFVSQVVHALGRDGRRRTGSRWPSSSSARCSTPATSCRSSTAPSSAPRPSGQARRTARRRWPMVVALSRHRRGHGAAVLLARRAAGARAAAGGRRLMAMDGKHWLDEPRNVKRLWRVLLAVLVATRAGRARRRAAPALRARGAVRLSCAGSASSPAWR